MESVARGTEGDDLPLVFKIPALFPSTENECSAREVAGLLGFGDVVLPAILGEWMRSMSVEALWFKTTENPDVST